MLPVEYVGWEPYLERGGEPDYCEPGPEAEPEDEPSATPQCFFCSIRSDCMPGYTDDQLEYGVTVGGVPAVGECVEFVPQITAARNA